MLGHTLKLIRLYNNETLFGAALYINLLPKQLIKIESGKTKVTLTTLERISELYQMPISQIFILNDMKEHFQMDDSQIWEEIERFYVTKQKETSEIVKTKNLGVKVC